MFFFSRYRDISPVEIILVILTDKETFDLILLRKTRKKRCVHLSGVCKLLDSTVRGCERKNMFLV